MLKKLRLALLVGLLCWAPVALATPEKSHLAENTAFVERTCAPWDGSAFMLWIPSKDFGGQADEWLRITVWSSPNGIRKAFRLGGAKSDSGNAALYLVLKTTGHRAYPSENAEDMEGTVAFTSLSGSADVVGTARLMSKSGRTVNAKFRAKWKKARPVFCG